jgi:uncharacterized membrane protein
VLWGAVLVPIQKKLSAAMTAAPAGDSIPPEWDALLVKWFRVGGVATILPLVVLVLMVLKPAF